MNRILFDFCLYVCTNEPGAIQSITVICWRIIAGKCEYCRLRIMSRTHSGMHPVLSCWRPVQNCRK